MGWVTPRTWVTGEPVTSSLLNVHVRDSQTWLYLTHRYTVGLGNISLASDSAATSQKTILSFPDVRWQLGPFAVTTSRITLTSAFPTGVRLQLLAAASWTNLTLTGNPGGRQLYIAKNGGASPLAQTSYANLGGRQNVVAVDWAPDAGDYYEVFAAHNVGSNLSLGILPSGFVAIVA